MLQNQTPSFEQSSSFLGELSPPSATESALHSSPTGAVQMKSALPPDGRAAGLRSAAPPTFQLKGEESEPPGPESELVSVRSEMKSLEKSLLAGNEGGDLLGQEEMERLASWLAEMSQASDKALRAALEQVKQSIGGEPTSGGQTAPVQRNDDRNQRRETWGEWFRRIARNNWLLSTLCALAGIELTRQANQPQTGGSELGHGGHSFGSLSRIPHTSQSNVYRQPYGSESKTSVDAKKAGGFGKIGKNEGQTSAKLDKFVNSLQPKRIVIGKHKLPITKAALRHFLTRHHPSFRIGPDKATQTNFPRKFNLDDMRYCINAVLRDEVTHHRVGLDAAPSGRHKMTCHVKEYNLNATVTVDGGAIVQFFTH